MKDGYGRQMPAFPGDGRAGGMEMAVRSEDGAWLVFSQPRAILRASDTSDVRECLRLAGEACSAGAWAAGFIAYEAAPGLDRALAVHAPGGIGLLRFGIFDKPAVVRDIPFDGGGYHVSAWEVQPSRERYLAAARRVMSYLRSGDTYQVNLTVRFRARFGGDPAAFFADLWRAQPTRYAAFMRFGGHALCSVSPELFFESDGRTIRSRPMKGTARRGLWFEDDERRFEALRNSGKDRAENVMIVDMIRNDLGRIAEAGSVRVAGLFDVERHPSVFQMTSTVECRSSAGLLHAFEALFPCSSVTGAPKVRTMQIIRELEDAPRGAYCGAIGYAGGGSMRFSVAIRTVTIDMEAGSAEYGAGGGIVADSAPEQEFDECLAKAAVLTEKTPEFSLLETMRWNADGGFFLLDRHIARIERSAAYFGFAIDPPELRRRLAAISESLGPGPSRVRVIVAADGAVSVEAAPLQESRSVARVALAASPIDAADRFFYHKTTCRAAYEAAMRARDDVDDVILWNAAGEVTESTTANIVVERAGRKTTPPLRCGLLAGTMRAQLLEDGVVEESVVRVEDLSLADRIWLVNSVRGWRPIELVH